MTASDDIGFALIRSVGSPGRRMIVRVIKLGKRFSRVETLQENEADRSTWQPLTRELWQFPTVEAAQAKLDELCQVEREYLDHIRTKNGADA